MHIKDIALTDYSHLEVGDGVYVVSYYRGDYTNGYTAQVVKRTKTRVTIAVPGSRYEDTYLVETGNYNEAVEYGAKFKSRENVYFLEEGPDLDEFRRYRANVNQAKELRKELARIADPFTSGYGPEPGVNSARDVDMLNRVVAALTRVEADVVAYQEK